MTFVIGAIKVHHHVVKKVRYLCYSFNFQN